MADGTNGHASGQANGHADGAANGAANGEINGAADGAGNGHVDGAATHGAPAGSAGEPERCVVIGSGPAGWTAAIYLARANIDPLVYEGALTEENRQAGTLPLGQLALTTEVENFPGFPAGNMDGYLDSALPADRIPWRTETDAHDCITGPELMEMMRQQAINFDTRVVTEDVVDVDASSRPFKLTISNGDVVYAHSVIVATGASAKWLHVPGEDEYKNAGVSACAVCDGALPRFRDQPVVVVGGGDSAMEEASYLAKFASRVHLIHRRGEFRASAIMAQRVLENEKIEVHWHTVVEEVLGSESEGVTGVRLRGTDDTDRVDDVPATGFFAAIGHTPNTDFLRGQVEMNPAGYVTWVKPFRTFTSVEGIFSAGDVSDDYYRQACTAAGTGCMAALDVERWLLAEGIGQGNDQRIASVV